MTNQNYLFSCK